MFGTQQRFGKDRGRGSLRHCGVGAASCRFAGVGASDCGLRLLEPSASIGECVSKESPTSNMRTILQRPVTIEITLR